MTQLAAKGHLGWHRTNKDRWRLERRAFRDRGWKHRVRYEGGTVMVDVEYPMPPGGGEVSKVARLRVVYPRHSYPAWMPVDVFDHHGDLGITEHRDPTRKGLLCLSHESDHDPHQLAADLIAVQVPKLMASRDDQDLAGTPSTTAMGLPVADPITGYSGAPKRVVVPSITIPEHIDGGVLVLRQRFDGSGGIVTSIVDQILAPGLSIQGLGTDVLRSFPVTTTGWWLRLSGWDPNQTAHQVWKRVEKLLPDLEAHPDPDRTTIELSPEQLTVVGMLVDNDQAPSDPPTWMFLIRGRLVSSEPHEQLYGTALLAGQEIDNNAMSARTPIAAGLVDKNVVLVGAGAIGHQIATDLARTGVKRLDIADRDWVELSTRSRQHAPITHAGHPKASALAEHLRDTSNAEQIEGWSLNVSHLLEPCEDSKQEVVRRQFMRRLLDADLIVDASANPTVTSMLNAAKRPLLTVAGTPGMWGGWVAMLGSGQDMGCYECLILLRTDGTDLDGDPWPVPPTDPDGWVTPTGCAEPTFVGTAADVATVAVHASRVAIHYLAEGVGLGGDYYVAALRDTDGNPSPVSWQATNIPIHPQCESRRHHLANPDRTTCDSPAHERQHDPT